MSMAERVEKEKSGMMQLIEEAAARRKMRSSIRVNVGNLVAKRYGIDGFWDIVDSHCEAACESLGWSRHPGCSITLRLQTLESAEGVVKSIQLYSQKIPGGKVLDLTPLAGKLPKIPVIELVALIFLIDGRAIWLKTDVKWDQDFLKALRSETGHLPLTCDF